MKELKIKERPFKDWKITSYKAQSPDNKYTFWIGNGFFSFRDYFSLEQFLDIIGFWERRKIWKELRKEMLLRLTEIYQRD